jgi:hypothetical protein
MITALSQLKVWKWLHGPSFQFKDTKAVCGQAASWESQL